MSENKVEEKWKSQIATTLTNRLQIVDTRGSGTIVHQYNLWRSKM